MPVVKGKYQYTKVFRPPGTQYGQARDASVATAISRAGSKFYAEFGYVPKQEETVIEVIGVTGDWVVDYFEVRDE